MEIEIQQLQPALLIEFYTAFLHVNDLQLVLNNKNLKKWELTSPTFFINKKVQ